MICPASRFLQVRKEEEGGLVGRMAHGTHRRCLITGVCSEQEAWAGPGPGAAPADRSA